MKITQKQYALALYESIKDKKQSEAGQIIKEFVSLLAYNNDIAKADKIINEFIKFYNKEEGIVEAEIKSARSMDDSVIKSLKNYIKEVAKAANVEVNQTEDKDLLGGVVIRYGDKVMDGSLKSRLQNLKQSLNK